MNTALRIFGTCLSGAILMLSLNAVPATAAGGKAFIDFGATGTSGDLLKESIDAPKATWYAVSSFQFGVGKDGSIPSLGSAVSGAGAGKVKRTTESMDVTLAGDGAQKAFDLATAGKPIAAVRLEIVKPNKANPGKLDPAVSVLMSNVMITSVAWTGKNDHPTTTVTLDYERIEIDQAKTGKPGPGGGVTVGGWDRVDNKSTATDAWNGST
jgi:type VI protein secretion system component Hcp